MNSPLRRLRVLVAPAAWVVSLACVAGVAATLFWRATAPRPLELPARIETDPRAVAQRIAGQHPFAGELPMAAAAPTSEVQFAVVAIATGFAGGPGFALLKRGEQPAEAYVAGEELASGVRLKRILADGVELERGGRIEHVALPADPPSPAVTSASAPPRPQPPPRAVIRPRSN